MYVNAQCNFLDIISFSFKLRGAHIREQQKKCISQNAWGNASERHQVNCGIFWNSCPHKLSLDMPVCNNTTCVRTQKLCLTETLVFRSSPVQISTGSTVTDIFMGVLTPSTKCCITTSKRITVTPCTPFPLHYSGIILPFHTIPKAAVVWDIMLCWLATHSWRREGCWHYLHGDRRTIFCYYKDIVRKLLQHVSNKLLINKLSYGHLWADGPNIWSRHDLHLAYKLHRADLLTPWLHKPGYTKATEQSPMDGVDNRSEGSPFLPTSVLPSSTQWLILTSKKCLVLLEVVTMFMWTEWPHDWKTIQGIVWPQGTDTQTSFWGHSIITLTSAALELTDMKCVTKVTLFY